MFQAKFSFLTSACVLAFSLCVLAAPLCAESLEQAVESTLNNHPNVEAAMANRDVFTQKRREEWADYFPRVNLRGTGGRIFGDNSTSRGLQVTRDSTYSDLWEGSVTLTQPIFDGFETSNRVDAAEMRRKSADYNIIDVRENLALRTVLVYLDVLRGREALAKMTKHNKKISDYQARIQKMVDEGAADKTMIVQTLDVKAQLESAMVSMEGQLNAANVEYAELVGRLPDDPMEKPVSPSNMIPDDTEEAIAFAKKNHPTLKGAAFTAQALDYDRKAEKQLYYPDVTGELSYLKRDQDDKIGGEVVDAKAVVRLNWDFSLAGGHIAHIRGAQNRHFESKARQAAVEREIKRKIRVAYSDLHTAVKQGKVQQDLFKINEDLFKVYEAQFEGARINLLQLLQADNALFNSELTLMNGRYKMQASEFSVLASMGRLQEALNVVSVRADEHE